MRRAKPVLEEAVRLGPKHQVTIPKRISKALKLKKGDHVLMRLVGSRVEMVPARLIPKDQLWSSEWQRKEREAEEDIAQGRIREFDSVQALLQDLRSGPSALSAC